MTTEAQTHAKCTVTRDSDGDIMYIVVRAEYYLEDTDAHENDPDRYHSGVSAKFKFDVHGTTAELAGVKDIEDGSPTGYETSLEFVKAIPIAEKAAMNVPGVEEVDSTEAWMMSRLDKGRTAI